MKTERRQGDSRHIHKSMAICVDFDGVIARLTESIEEMGEAMPGAAESLKRFQEIGYKIIIHTARPSHPEHVREIETYLNERDIPFDEIGVNSDCDWESAKPLADLYIDDRALRFEGDWAKTYNTAVSILKR